MNFEKYPSKEAFEYPFSFIEDNAVGYYLKDILVPLPTEGMKTVFEDPGNFPHNIQVYLFGRKRENDVSDWDLLCLLDNGNYAYYTAGCDYTGFDCRGEMKLYVAKTLGKLVDMAMPQEVRDAFTNIFNDEG